MKKIKGFTLIELITVMAIIGVLAGILVPVMISYLNDAKLSKANANAKQVYSTAASYATACEKEGVDQIPDFSSQRIPSIPADRIVPYDGQHLLDFMGKVFGPSNNHAGFASVKFDGNIPRKAAWADSTESDMVGIYPGAADKPGASMSLSDG